MLDEHIYVQEIPPEPRRQVGRADVSVAAAPTRPGAHEAIGVGVLDATGYADFIYAGRSDPRLSSRDDAWARTYVPSTP
jgi:hypothetical protein